MTVQSFWPRTARRAGGWTCRRSRRRTTTSSTAYVQVDGRDLVTLSFGIGELGMEVEVTVFDSTRIDGGIAWQGTASVDHGESED